MLSTKIRTIIISLIAAGSIVTVAIAPMAAQARPAGATGLTREELEKEGGSCSYVATDFWECSDKNGKKFYCNHEGCQSVKVVVGGGRERLPLVTVNASLVATEPPVVTKPTLPVTSRTLATF